MEKHLIYTVFLCSYVLTGCSNEDYLIENPNRLKELQKIARRNECNVTVNIMNDSIKNTPLNKEEKTKYNNLFAQMAKLNNLTFSLTPQQQKTRAIDSHSYYKELNYNGQYYTVAIYWKEDNETKNIFDIEAGIGGVKVIGGDRYTVNYVRHNIINANEHEISVEIKANHTIDTFPIVNGNIDYSRGSLMSITSKIFAEGKVYPKSMDGEFTIRFVGNGSWEMEDL